MKDDEKNPVAAAFDLSRRARFVYVTSNGREGYPNTRIMFNLLKTRAKAIASGPASLPAGFGTWLGTNTSSDKVKEMRRDPRVCLYYSDTTKFEALTLLGSVEEVGDRSVKSALWMRGWDIYYAGGLDGGDFTVLRFVPERGRYYHGLRLFDFDASGVLPRRGTRGRRAR